MHLDNRTDGSRLPRLQAILSASSADCQRSVSCDLEKDTSFRARAKCCNRYSHSACRGCRTHWSLRRCSLVFYRVGMRILARLKTAVSRASLPSWMEFAHQSARYCHSFGIFPPAQHALKYQPFPVLLRIVCQLSYPRNPSTPGEARYPSVQPHLSSFLLMHLQPSLSAPLATL